MTVSGKEKIVILGGGASGLAAASKAKRSNPALDIVVLEKELTAGTALCSLPLVIDGGIPPENAFIKPISYFEKELGIKILKGVEILSINRNTHTITSTQTQDSKKQILPYDKLIIALGARPVSPNFAYMNGKKNVFFINNLSETLRMLKYIEENRSRSAAVIGCGVYGIALADAMIKRGMNVIILESKPVPLDEYNVKIREIIIEKIKKTGIELIPGCGRIEADGDEKINFLLSDGGKIAADLVIPALGRRPENALAQDAGIACDMDGFIITDDFRITNDFDILACGDCATVKCAVTGQRTNFSSAAIAANTGYIAGLNAAGVHEQSPATTRTRISKIGECFFGRTGLDALQAKTEGYDYFESVVQIDPTLDERHVQKIVLQMIFNRKNGRLLGTQAVGGREVEAELNLASFALQNAMTAKSIASFESAFSPHSSNLKHPIHFAARKALKEL